MQRCPNCGGGELEIIAAILERPVIEKILTHLAHSAGTARSSSSHCLSTTDTRDSATASMKHKHVDLAASSVFQGAREVDTKFSKCLTTHFFPADVEVRQIFHAWTDCLQQETLWGNDDSFFIATLLELGQSSRFEPVGRVRRH